jgi:ribokinase
MSAIAVLGSLNVDLVTQVDRFPKPGETIVARSFEIFPGGKGANQAVACGRLGATVTLFGAVGRDEFAPRLIESLQSSGVRTDNLRFFDDLPTGVASIWVDAHGENAIAIAMGANARVDRAYLDEILPSLKGFSWLLLQLEIPMDSMRYLLERLPTDGPRVILDPAPARSLKGFPTERLWLITPNERELHALTGMPTDTEADLRRACQVLREKTGVRAVLCKAGSRGAYLEDGVRFRHFPGYSVQSVDTTAAGDAFNGGLATMLAEGQALERAIAFANAVGALCVTKPGAQPSLPYREEVEAFLRTQREWDVP